MRPDSNSPRASGAAAARGPRIVVPPPGPRARSIVARDQAVTSSCYIKEYPLVIAGGEGPFVDDVDGNRYLDFMAGIAVCTTGHAHPRVVEAVREAAGRFLHICGSDFYFEGMAALAERLARLAPGSSPKRVFLANSGTEAVEGAIKLARHATGRTAVIAFKGAFHGRTLGALSLTSSKARQHHGFAPLVPEVHHVAFGYCYRCEFGKTFPDCRLHCVAAIEQDLLTRHLDPRDVAAIFVEPVQGEGGYIAPPPGWLRALRELCDRHGILLVADEVQCGIGRTGRMFACEHEGVEPDILLAAKGLASGMPIGAIVSRQAITRWEPGSHGSTFGGNPVCCAAALATLDLVEEELLENARRRGERLGAALGALQARHAATDDRPGIGEVRGLGLMWGVELVRDARTRQPAAELAHAVVEEAFRQGLLLLACGQSTLRMAPPLVITDADVDGAVAIVDRILGESGLR